MTSKRVYGVNMMFDMDGLSQAQLSPSSLAWKTATEGSPSLVMGKPSKTKKHTKEDSGSKKKKKQKSDKKKKKKEKTGDKAKATTAGRLHEDDYEEDDFEDDEVDKTPLKTRKQKQEEEEYKKRKKQNPYSPSMSIEELQYFSPHDDRNKRHYFEENANNQNTNDGDDAFRMGQLVELQRSVERLRQQRVMVERIKRDAQGKDQRILELQNMVDHLRSQVSQYSYEALQRERHLRTKLLEAEEAANQTRNAEQAIVDELKKLLLNAQSTENQLRRDLARAHADLEEHKKSNGNQLDALYDKNRSLENANRRLEEQMMDLKSELEEKQRDLQRYEMKQYDISSMQSKQLEEIEKQRMLERSELQEAKETIRSLKYITQKQKEQMEGLHQTITEAENRENLLQETIKELEENANILRQQVDNGERGDSTIRENLAATTKKLLDAERTIEELQHQLVQAQFDQQVIQQDSHRKKEKYDTYEESLQRAAAHRERMEVQLKHLSDRVQELQRQLVEEMALNSSLSKQLDEERKSRTKVSKERLKILSQFYEEEHKLKETLDHPMFHVDDDDDDDEDDHEDNYDDVPIEQQRRRGDGSTPSSTSSRSYSGSSSSTENSATIRIHFKDPDATGHANARVTSTTTHSPTEQQHHHHHAPQIAFKSTAASRAKTVKQASTKPKQKSKRKANK